MSSEPSAQPAPASKEAGERLETAAPGEAGEPQQAAAPVGHQYARPRDAYLAGMRAVVPFLFGTVPFGLVTGIATKAAGLSATASVVMTVMVFAGTAQIASLPLLTAGAPALVVILTAFIINLRFVIYSATAAPYFKHLNLRWKFLLGYFMTDTGFALFMRRVATQPQMRYRHYYFLGSGVTVASVWVLTAAIGVMAGSKVPPAWRLEFAATLGILALLAPFVRSKPDLAATIVGGGVALAASGLPMKLGLVVGAAAGIAAGVLAEQALKPKVRETL